MKSRILNIPGKGQIILDPQGNTTNASVPMQGHLGAKLFRDGKPLAAKKFLTRWGKFWNYSGQDLDAPFLDLGKGLVTNVGVLALASDWNWSPVGLGTLRLANQHMTGTGTAAAAATDIYLQTISTNGGQTAVAGTQSTVSAANSQKYQTVATISYTGTEAVTEWGLHTSATQKSTTGSPATAASSTSLTGTGAPFTASSSSVRGEQQYIVVDATGGVWGLVTSNTTSVLTVVAWYKITDGTAGSTPGSTDAFAIYPVLWDHKVFSAINVVSGDSIQFTYDLTCTSGG
jgi:hypothetical protein